MDAPSSAFFQPILEHYIMHSSPDVMQERTITNEVPGYYEVIFLNRVAHVYLEENSLGPISRREALVALVGIMLTSRLSRSSASTLNASLRCCCLIWTRA